MIDEPLYFHESLKYLIDNLTNTIASITWLESSVGNAKEYFKKWPYIVTLDCSFSNQSIKVDKSIFSSIKEDNFVEGRTPLFTGTLVNSFRMFTVAAKDIIWEEPIFAKYLHKPEFQFLKHLRNASAHSNKLFWGNKEQRNKTIRDLPVLWRGKEIKNDCEGSMLYFEFLAPGDILFLLSDISSVVRS
jgi:hypothetical protein